MSPRTCSRQGLDANGRQIGYEDVFSKIEMCREHYARVGLGKDFVDQFVR